MWKWKVLIRWSFQAIIERCNQHVFQGAWSPLAHSIWQLGWHFCILWICFIWDNCHIDFASSGSACEVNPWMLAQKKRIPVKRECWRLEMAVFHCFFWVKTFQLCQFWRSLSDTRQLFKKSSRSVRQNIYPKRPAKCRAAAQTFSECVSSFPHYCIINNKKIYLLF